MAGFSNETGALIEEPEHIRQSIGVILRTPVGTRVMRREFGVSYLNEDGTRNPDIDAAQIASIAMTAISKYEPRIRDVLVKPEFSGSVLSEISVTYTEIKSGNTGEIVVSYS